MFGGLDLKGGGDNSKKSAPAAASSGFGFLNASVPAPESTSEEMQATAGPNSGFSFLNAGPSPAAAAAAAAPSPPTAMSGFSFLQQGAEAAPPPTLETVTVPTESTAAESSGFSFMIHPPEKGPVAASASASSGEQVSLSESVVESAAPSAASPFGFLSATPPADDSEPPLPAPSVATTAAHSISSVASPTLAPPNVLEFPSATPAMRMPSPSLPAGTGITFGTASAKPGVRKKKTRAQKVGMGAPAATSTTMSPPKSATPTSVSIPTSAPSANETRDAAAKAQRRADEFMSKKTIEQATATPPKDSTSGLTMEIPKYDTVPAVLASPSTDEEVARAKRAAEEAQKMAAAAPANKPKGGFMGTFFKGFGGSHSSLPAISSSGKGNTPKPSPPTSVHDGGAVDRMAKQQQEMKRAAAERQMQLQQQTTGTTTTKPSKDDNHFVASTSVGGYTPEPLDLAATPPPTSTSGLSILSNFDTSSKPVTSITTTTTEAPKIVVRELAPTPRKKKTPTQAFEEYQAIFAQSVHRAMQQVEAVRSQQRMLLEERFVALAKQRLSIQQIQQTETQLQVAVEKEDYELADQLGQIVEAHHRERAEVASMIDSIAKGLVQLESQKTLVVQGVATCFDNLAVRIKDLQEQETSKEGRESDSGTFRKYASISKQLSAEQERLQQDLKHLERDEQLVFEERAELESSISEQSGEYEGQQNHVKDKLTIVEEEIVELRRELEAKNKIAAGLRSEMYGLEDNISKVRVKFSRQLTRVDKKERSVQENRFEWESEQTTFKRQKEAHDLQVQSHSEALLAHDILVKTLDTELQMCKEFAGMVPTKLGFMQDEMKTNEAEDAEAEGDLAQLQANVVKCEVAVGEAKVLLKAATATLSNLETEHTMLIGRVPQLEAEKKGAAAKRDFKAASKASKEIKDAVVRLKECEEELVGEAAEKKRTAAEEMKRLRAELEATRKIAQEKEKIFGIAKMHALAKQIKHLVDTKQELCGETTSSENTVKGVGAFVLDGQIKALKEEGQNLGSKYGRWNDLMKELLGEDGDTTEPGHENFKKEEAASASTPVDDGLTSEERIANVRDLIRRIQEAEEALEAAAGREDFDEAARLQEVFESLQMELENTNLTDEESELAFADEEPAPSATEDLSKKDVDSPIAQEESTEEDVENKLCADTTEPAVSVNAEEALNEDAEITQSVDDGEGEGPGTIDTEIDSKENDTTVEEEASDVPAQHMEVDDKGDALENGSSEVIKEETTTDDKGKNVEIGSDQADDLGDETPLVPEADTNDDAGNEE